MTADALVAHLRRACRELNCRSGVRDHAEAVERIVAAAVAAVPEASTVGLTPADTHPSTLDGVTAPIGELDALQRELHEGPAMEVLDDPPPDGTVVAADFAGSDGARWPTFSEHVLDAGHRSMISVRLEVEGAPRAALNLYGSRADAFDGQARRAAGVFALHAGMLLLAAEQAACLQRALANRDLIGRAKGVMMERFGLDEDAAFARLVEASQASNIKVVDVARWVDEQCGERATSGAGPGRPHVA
ncbi:GAF and ANTAR domain-containing protein [Actinomycetospora lemnae]|uniref:GAF and ANTAR domain-containing protein n=1 Tax=Actinomycetospora lemnae TaxID=3019891 RepID=A0ABT5SZE1_9PSEU|nr:GAF and ANTAR domain-containing protein [Actinomycetospora sp. DW7H6]MDD7967352.1 GAF and ANTAR domain-containing protein [Actinomycetospora sp. DW7H6]